MKNILSSVMLILLSVFLLVSFTACGKDEVPEEPVVIVEEPKEEVKPIVKPEKVEEPVEIVEEEYTGPYNPLTGLPVDEDISQNRPYAVMINDIYAALPQQGISKADIIYEAQVEGGITRMMAVYQDISDAGPVGSIRSSRHYYIDLAQGHDAIYVHAGGSPQAYSLLSARDIDNIDGVQGTGETFYRDSYRRSAMGYEHSMLLDPSLLPGFVEKYEMRSQHSEDYVCNMMFADDEDLKIAGDGSNIATYVTVAFSSSKDTIFEYNADEKLYYASQYGMAYRDANDDTQVSAKNIIVVFADVYAIAGDSAGRMETILTGSGDGYFICNGEYVPITWSKEDNTSQFVYSDMNGAPITFGRGTSYVCIVDIGNSVTFE